MSVSALTGYGSLLGTHGARAFTAAALVGRMPIAMLGIGTVLLVEDRRGSYALAGAVSAAYALGLALLGPGVSRLVDRLGQRRVLPWSVLLTAVGIVAVVLLAGADVPAWTLLPAAAVMSASASQLGACARARWSVLLARRPAELERAFAWEAVVDEVVFVLGPLLVVLCALYDPALGLLLALVLTSAGTAWFVAQRSTEPPVVVRHESHPPAMRSPGLRVVVAAMVFVGVLFGTVEVSMVAFAEQRGSTSGSGMLLALVALGSAVAGLVYGALHLRTPLPRRFRLALAVLALGMVPVLLAPTVALMAPAALLAGIAVSPTLICAYGLTETLVPAPSRTEGFSWINTGLGVGVALGFAGSGAVAEQAGARVALFGALGGALVAGAVAVAGRRALAVPVAVTARTDQPPTAGAGEAVEPRRVHPAVPGTCMPYPSHTEQAPADQDAGAGSVEGAPYAATRQDQ